MDKRYFLSYSNYDGREFRFFDDEDELKEFVADNPEMTVKDAFEFRYVRPITIFHVGE